MCCCSLGRSTVSNDFGLGGRRYSADLVSLKFDFKAKQKN